MISTEEEALARTRCVFYTKSLKKERKKKFDLDSREERRSNKRELKSRRKRRIAFRKRKKEEKKKKKKIGKFWKFFS